MENYIFFKSIIDNDPAPIVICDTEHVIFYMNPSAVKNYSKSGGAALIGSSLLGCHNERSCEMIKKVVGWFSASANNNKVHTFYNAKQNKDVYMIALRDESGRLIGYYEKHEYRNIDQAPFYEID